MYQIRGLSEEFVWVDNLDLESLNKIFFDLVINNLSSPISFISCYDDMVKNYPITKELIINSIRSAVTVFDKSTGKNITSMFGSNVKDNGLYYTVKADFIGFHGHYQKQYMEDHLKFISENTGKEITIYRPDLTPETRFVIGNKRVYTPEDGIVESYYTPDTPNRLVLNEGSFDTLLSKLKDKYKFFNYDF
ncbi:hypothetical protein [Proteus phage J3S]